MKRKEKWNFKRIQKGNMGKNEKDKTVIYDLATAPNVLISGGTEEKRNILINSMISTLLENVEHTKLKIHIVGEEQKLDNFPYEQFYNVKKYSNFKNFTGSQKLNVRHKNFQLQDYDCKDIEKWNKNDFFPPMKYDIIFITDFYDIKQELWEEIAENISEICMDGSACGSHIIVACRKTPTRNLRVSCLLKVCFKMDAAEQSKLCLGEYGAEKLTEDNEILIHKYKSNLIEKSFIK